ncbi:MAG: colicin E3/pyocin S6 family cytotoxin [Desulfuromonadales bacterium]|nr:colicin E3/pyocin S6 family cytotoxin [Desulfuromonadales bacterium]
MHKLVSVTAWLVFSLCLLAAQPALAETVYYYHTDPAGTPLAITNQYGVKIWEADYLPFGEVYTETGVANDRKFVGKERDEESNLDYFGARYHYAKIGRFLAPDPVRAVDVNTGRINGQVLADPQRGNVYAYSLNNPYKYVDKDGEFAQLALLPIVEWGLPALISLLSVKAANDTYRAFNESNGTKNKDLPASKTNIGKDQPPPKEIEGIPDLSPTKPKTPVQGGGGLRKRWKDNDGNIYEWDRQHGTLEKYNKKGKHLGEYNPKTGEQTKKPNKSRKVEP